MALTMTTSSASRLTRKMAWARWVCSAAAVTITPAGSRPARSGWKPERSLVVASTSRWASTTPPVWSNAASSVTAAPSRWSRRAASCRRPRARVEGGGWVGAAGRPATHRPSGRPRRRRSVRAPGGWLPPGEGDDARAAGHGGHPARQIGWGCQRPTRRSRSPTGRRPRPRRRLRRARRPGGGVGLCGHAGPVAPGQAPQQARAFVRVKRPGIATVGGCGRDRGREVGRHGASVEVMGGNNHTLSEARAWCTSASPAHHHPGHHDTLTGPCRVGGWRWWLTRGVAAPRNVRRGCRGPAAGSHLMVRAPEGRAHQEEHHDEVHAADELRAD